MGPKKIKYFSTALINNRRFGGALGTAKAPETPKPVNWGKPYLSRVGCEGALGREARRVGVPQDPAMGEPAPHPPDGRVCIALLGFDLVLTRAVPH